MSDIPFPVLTHLINLFVTQWMQILLKVFKDVENCLWKHVEDLTLLHFHDFRETPLCESVMYSMPTEFSLT